MLPFRTTFLLHSLFLDTLFITGIYLHKQIDFSIIVEPKTGCCFFFLLHVALGKINRLVLFFF